MLMCDTWYIQQASRSQSSKIHSKEESANRQIKKNAEKEHVGCTEVIRPLRVLDFWIKSLAKAQKLWNPRTESVFRADYGD